MFYGDIITQANDAGRNGLGLFASTSDATRVALCAGLSRVANPAPGHEGKLSSA